MAECANCGQPVAEHRCLHLIPCCYCRGIEMPFTVETSTAPLHPGSHEPPPSQSDDSAGVPNG